MDINVCKIGYSVSTTPKRFDSERDYFNNCEGITYLHNDKYKEGMASAKNRALKYLYDRGCKYFILMDDDTKVLDKDFGRYLIDVCERTGIQQITYPDHKSETILRKNIHGIDFTQHRHGAGCLLFITRQVVEKVGFLSTKYDNIWGWAHVAYSQRIFRAGFMPNCKGWRTTPDKLKDLFWSDDIDGERIEQNFNEDEKAVMMRQGKAEFYRELRGNIYYPFSERLNG